MHYLMVSSVTDIGHLKFFDAETGTIIFHVRKPEVGVEYGLKCDGTRDILVQRVDVPKERRFKLPSNFETLGDIERERVRVEEKRHYEAEDKRRSVASRVIAEVRVKKDQSDLSVEI